jgi:hypothetical protein
MSNDKTIQFQHFRWFKDITIILSPLPPFQIEAEVVEQDTALVLEPTFEVAYPNESAEELINQAFEIPPITPGSVVVRGNFPLKLVAIVHDFDEEPNWKEEWIVKALYSILYLSEQFQLQAIAIPLLCTRHGSLEKQRFFDILHSVIEQVVPVHLKKIWLAVPE